MKLEFFLLFESLESDAEGTLLIFPILLCVYKHLKRKRNFLIFPPKKKSSVIFNLGKFLNINPRHKKNRKRERWKKKTKKAIRLNDRYVIAFGSIMYDKRNKMENIYLMLFLAFFYFGCLCASSLGFWRTSSFVSKVGRSNHLLGSESFWDFLMECEGVNIK